MEAKHHEQSTSFLLFGEVLNSAFTFRLNPAGITFTQKSF